MRCPDSCAHFSFRKCSPAGADGAFEHGRAKQMCASQRNLLGAEAHCSFASVNLQRAPSLQRVGTPHPQNHARLLGMLPLSFPTSPNGMTCVLEAPPPPSPPPPPPTPQASSSCLHRPRKTPPMKFSMGTQPAHKRVLIHKRTQAKPINTHGTTARTGRRPDVQQHAPPVPGRPNAPAGHCPSGGSTSLADGPWALWSAVA